MKNIIRIISDIIFNPFRAINSISEKIYLKEALLLLASLVLWRIIKISLLLPSSLREEVTKSFVYFQYDFKLLEFLVTYLYYFGLLILEALILKYSAELLFGAGKKIKLLSIFTFLCFVGVVNILVGLFQITISYINNSYLAYLISGAIAAIWILILFAIFIKKMYELHIWKVILILLITWILNRVFIYPLAKTISIFVS
jgi:hypothetical protein